MMSSAFLFPGQGSQKVGMAADFVAAFDSVKQRFDQANAILGRDLVKIISEGPEADLTSTRNTQPALFLVETAITDILIAKGVSPRCTLGHSLGEYSALYAAGVFSFEDGLKIVAKRGELMAAAGISAPGTMAAVIGLTREKISEVLATITEGVVVTANENSPDQTVISGTVAAVNAASEKLQAAGAKRVVPLTVSGAFHSPLMQPVADEFSRFLESFSFLQPRCPVVANVTAAPVSDPLELKRLLVRQLVSPVRWVDSMKYLVEQGVADAYEIGPGSVLKGLARKCSEALNVVSCAAVDNIYSLGL
jgi:[acyl-carrier-protein] S-malonyltransferase